jgi:hypothetical protein
MTRTATRNSSKLRAAHVAVWLSATLVSAACGENPQPSADGGLDATPTDAALDAGSYGAAALGSSSITEDSRTWTETRYRLRRAGRPRRPTCSGSRRTSRGRGRWSW